MLSALASRRSFSLTSAVIRFSTGSSMPSLRVSSHALQAASPLAAPSFEARRWSSTSSSLAKLPVPPLMQTLNRYVNVLRPLVSPAELEQNLKLIAEFTKAGGDGERLQKLLEARAAKTENWLSDWWLQVAYLEPRYPLIINVSPGLSFPPQNFSGVDGQISFAAKLISGLLEYRRLIDERELPSDVGGDGKPLDMSQYELLFGTCRIPEMPVDRMRYGCKEPRPSRHIAVAYRGHFYKLVVYDEKRALSVPAIGDLLKKVVAGAPSQLQVSNQVGLLTAENRDVWATAYNRIRKRSTQNANSLEALETSLFLVSIDEPTKPSAKTRTRANEMGRQLLAGGGSASNSGNRWFDKTMQFIIGYDGECGMTYEHSPAEGPPVAALMDFALSYIGKHRSMPDSIAQSATPTRLAFDLDAEDARVIESAAKNLDKLVDDIEIELMQFAHFGKNFIKTQRVSPDSFIQLGLELAFYKMHNECPATYETGTLRRFAFGRTDTIRLPTTASVEFVGAMSDARCTDVERAKKLRAAVESHKEYTNAACSGKGIDRHLLGLRLIAKENGVQTPKFLETEAYKKALHYKLSTSQVAAKHESVMFFGPMYADCYGVCYNPQPERINLGISAFNSFAATSAERFSRAIAASFVEMEGVLARTAKAHL